MAHPGGLSSILGAQTPNTPPPSRSTFPATGLFTGPTAFNQQSTLVPHLYGVATSVLRNTQSGDPLAHTNTTTAPQVLTALPLGDQFALLASNDATSGSTFMVHALTPDPAATRASRMPPVKSLRASIADLTDTLRSGLWTQRTWKQYSSLWSRFYRYAALRSLPMSDRTAALFINDMEVQATTKSAYASQMANLLTRMGLPNSALRLLAHAQRGAGATQPRRQSSPIPKSVLVEVAHAQDTRTCVGLLLAWKTASRWSDVSRCAKNSFVHVTPERIIMNFGNRTKTSRHNVARPELLVVVEGDFTLEISAYLLPLMRSRKVRGETRLFPIETAKIREILRPYGYKAHSVKRGALAHVVEAMEGKDIPLYLIGVLARHASSLQFLPPVTLQYLSNVPKLAVLIGTQKLTALL